MDAGSDDEEEEDDEVEEGEEGESKREGGPLADKEKLHEEGPSSDAEERAGIEAGCANS